MTKRNTKRSGYTPCDCRDCMELAIDGGLCHECEDAGCDPEGAEECCCDDLDGHGEPL